MLKKVLLLVCLTLPLNATDFQVTVTIETAKATEVLALVTAWRLRQLNPDGTVKFANNMALGEDILLTALRRVIRDQCEFDPANCPAWYKTHRDARETALAGIDTEVNAAVTP